MSFSRLPYDNDAYVTNLNQTIGSGAYQLETPRVDCGDCSFYSGGGMNLNMFNDGMCEKELIDVDSELLGITRKSSHCPARKYLPSEKPFCKAKQLTKDCTFLTPEPTLISNPKATNKETTVNRWQYLCKDEQRHALIDFDWNINNRLITKEMHRPCRPNPIDQSGCLPPKCNSFIKYDWSSRYSNRPANMLPQNALGFCSSISQL